MARQVEWSDEALADVADIVSYIEQQSPDNARRVLHAINDAALSLVSFPLAHRVVPEWQDQERRETFVHRWRLMYRILPDRIRIVGVIHGSRLLSNIDGRSFQEAGQAEYQVA